MASDSLTVQPLLKRGARIAVVAPAGIPDPDLLDKGMALLGDWGYDVVPGKHLRASYRYNGGTLTQRVQDLNWALSGEDLDAVWLARGGYGCVHCLPHLPATLPKARVLVGNSDATSLLSALYGRGHTQLIHGPMLESLATRVDDKTRTGMLRLLTTSDAPTLPVAQLTGPVGNIGGNVVGGNLTVLASVAGTAWALREPQGIVMLEDVGEAAYRLDRCVMQLISSGALGGARAVVFGEFTRCTLPRDADHTIADVMRDLLEPLGIPVFTGAEFGHGSRNLPWVYGRPAFIREGAVNYGRSGKRASDKET
jgi:muramoyltetrapeptide carboxypeptidase